MPPAVVVDVLDRYVGRVVSNLLTDLDGALDASKGAGADVGPDFVSACGAPVLPLGVPRSHAATASIEMTTASDRTRRLGPCDMAR